MIDGVDQFGGSLGSLLDGLGGAGVGVRGMGDARLVVGAREVV